MARESTLCISGQTPTTASQAFQFGTNKRLNTISHVENKLIVEIDGAKLSGAYVPVRLKDTLALRQKAQVYA